MKEIVTQTLPDVPEQGVVYVMPTQPKEPGFYEERTDRNIGWISREEQASLRGMTVGIAGCGGMGGLVAQILLRAGVGTLKIADCEAFDLSNLNRQAGATLSTIGVSKAFATARLLRNTTDDATVIVYPEGINEACVDHFLEGCDLVLDEIEYWAVAGRILLHQKARAKGIDLLNGNTVGFGTRLFLFTPTSKTIEACFGNLNYEEAKAFDAAVEDGSVSKEQKIRVMLAVLLGLIPEYPTYSPKSEPCGHIAAALRRLGQEGKAPIIGTNPPMASGFLADHALLHLLRRSGVKRHTVKLPPTPGYLYFDAALMKARVRRFHPLLFWWHRQKIRLITRMATRLANAQKD